MPNAIEIEVNGKRYPVNYDPQTPLLYVCATNSVLLAANTDVEKGSAVRAQCY